MRPLTSIIAAATLGTKPESSALPPRPEEPADCNRSRLRPHAADRPKNLTQRLFVIRFATVAGERSQQSVAGIAADAGMPAGNDVETGYGGSSEVAQLYQ